MILPDCRPSRCSGNDRFAGIDRNIAANLRIYREAGNVSQEELAQRMTDRGFGFTQATIWKIENGQRPVKASELAALADSLEIIGLGNFMAEPGDTRHHVQLEQANRNAYDTYGGLKQAAAAYIEAQFNLVVAARQAHDAGITVTELHTSWLDTPAERAVVEARVEIMQHDAQSEQVDNAVDKVIDALRTAGYEPALRIQDVKIIGGGPPSAWTPPPPADPE